MDKETILIVDDEKEIRDLVNIYLKNEGYNTILAEDGIEAIEILESKDIHLIILDVMMPKLDGIQACMKIRAEKNMPIIMLSAKSQDIDKINGLITGADDYMTKPFNPLELIARVKSQLRRYIRLNTPMIKNDGVIEIDDLTINVDTHEIKVEGKDIKLTPREFDILELLARNRGIVFSIEKIYERVWKEDFLESENTVMVHIRKIREKLEKNTRNPKYIKTVWGVGYKIEN
ncbi:response regulator transcription factor [Clostridium swellfunianum]|uniref:response regulator transcription factor n=1 Tax=Clostridium swellfunianum TaxID=1367462 RepID=UPI00202FA1B7|nr:response regulator transcription factor [Clostridium swellfunianum]MCM0648363.1 response regulator transcription factor [Clostridium swellfunianum]